MSPSVPRAPEAPPNVTLLGDAMLAMAPTLGRGANVAGGGTELRDAGYGR